MAQDTPVRAVARCLRCHRLLHDPVYAARQIGPVCGGRRRPSHPRRRDPPTDMTPIYPIDGQLPLPLWDDDEGPA